MKRRGLLGWACAHCSLFGLTQAARAQDPAYVMPDRFVRPDLATDEGGLWAMVDREETRLRRSHAVMREGGLRDYLTQLSCKLAGSHCSDLRVYPVRMPWFNASMAPNGMIQVWSGLLLRVENEAQLAAVIGHEIGHYLQRHSVARLRDARSRSAFGQFLGIALGGIGAIAQLALIAGAYAYSRDHEREADRIGLQLMKQAGYDPTQAAAVWANLRAEVSAGAGGDPSQRSVLFATHPASQEREAELARQAGDAGGERAEEAYQRQIAPHRFALLEDELNRGQYEETLVLLERLAKRRGPDAELGYFRGETYRLRGTPEDLDSALEHLRASAELPNAPAQVHRAMGLAFQKKSMKSEAARAFERYLELAPQAMDAALIQSYLSEMKS